MTIWDEILAAMRGGIPPEDFRRWFNETAYASDSGDQITVWVPTESIRRHIAAHYQENLDRALARGRRTGQPLSILILDLDAFKQVNDEQGHSAGDMLLKSIAGRLKKNLRATQSLTCGVVTYVPQSATCTGPVMCNQTLR
jgi:chromosomal replication initiation ATPase DnaA